MSKMGKKLVTLSAALLATAGIFACVLFGREAHTFLRRTPGSSFSFTEQKIAPISLVIPCAAEDLVVLPMLLTSVLQQTYLPAETIVVVNVGRRDEEEKVALLNFHQTNNSVNLQDKEYYGPYLAHAKPTEQAVTKIPNLSIRIRSKPLFAGNNRAFGARQASNEIVSFFDCDDYMLPHRIEYLYKTFLSHPELEAVIHGLITVDASKWNAEQNAANPPPLDIHEIKFPWTYEDIFNHLPRERYAHLKDGEPQQKGENTWFFPMYMKLPNRRKTIRNGHNGWLTVKKSALEEVPYPEDLSRGQDSLYNWRLIQNQRKWNFLPVKLGYYVRHQR